MFLHRLTLALLAQIFHTVQICGASLLLLLFLFLLLLRLRLRLLSLLPLRPLLLPASSSQWVG